MYLITAPLTPLDAFHTDSLRSAVARDPLSVWPANVVGLPCTTSGWLVITAGCAGRRQGGRPPSSHTRRDLEHQAGKTRGRAARSAEQRKGLSHVQYG